MIYYIKYINNKIIKKNIFINIKSFNFKKKTKI